MERGVSVEVFALAGGAHRFFVAAADVWVHLEFSRVDAVYHQMQHLGNKWADAHAEAEMLEEAKKCVLATITLHYIGDGGTKAAAEVQAYASQEYQDHIKRMVEARRRANLAKIELESIKTHLNLTRTYEATRREEMKML